MLTVGCAVIGSGKQPAIRLVDMDRVRFGRALGQGAREAAKALVKAADAAAAPNPRPAAPKPVTKDARPAGAVLADHVQRAQVTRANMKRGGRRFSKAVWAPMARAGSVLWLEVTGVLFGMFAVAAGAAVWRDRGNFLAGGNAGQHAWFAAAMLAVFAYFTISSYVKAAKRGKR